MKLEDIIYNFINMFNIIRSCKIDIKGKILKLEEKKIFGNAYQNLQKE